MSKFNLGSRREIQNKILQALLILSKKEVVDLNFLNLLVTIVERNIMESASPVLMDDMGVEIMIIKWNIFLFVWLEEGRSHKLLIMARKHDASKMNHFDVLQANKDKVVDPNETISMW